MIIMPPHQVKTSEKKQLVPSTSIKGTGVQYYYPASSHYATSVTVYCDYCGKNITTQASVGWTRARSIACHSKNSKWSGDCESCLTCLSEVTEEYDCIISPRKPCIPENVHISDNMHVLNFGNIWKDDKESKKCLRCSSSDPNRPYSPAHNRQMRLFNIGISSERGCLCLMCAAHLSKLLKPIDRLFIRETIEKGACLVNP
jgi:hypothetical protein